MNKQLGIDLRKAKKACEQLDNSKVKYTHFGRLLNSWMKLWIWFWFLGIMYTVVTFVSSF